MAMAQEQPASSLATRWQRTCRWLKRVTTFLWGTFFVGFIINVVSTVSTSTTDTPLSKLLVVHWVLTYPIPIILGAVVFLLLTIVSWIGSRERIASSILSPEQQSRLIILKSLHKAYTDELDSSLQGIARIALGLHERFDMTHHARMSTWQSGQTERTLPDGTTIIDAYEQAGNGLLILGEPGAGKSTLLYDLAQVLLSRAEQNESQPLPVILNLSSWATRRLPLEQWLVEVLQRRYLIPRQQSQRWLQQAKLFPLLDGLDEVAASARDACVEAINTYQSEHLIPLVVCSRREEYQAMSKRLTLQSAVIIQPLTSEQVKDYLTKAEEALAAVQTVMKTNPVLQELLTTPLMLSVVMLTYKDKAIKDLPQLGSPEEQQRQVFERYVTQALALKRERPWCFASQPTRKWLTWLAQQMQQRNLTQFYLESLEYAWLPTKQVQSLFLWLLGLFSGLLSGLLVILVGAVFFGLLSGLLFGLLFGLLVGVFFGLLGKGTDFTQSELSWSWHKFRQESEGVLFTLVPIYGLPLGLVFGLVFGLLYGLLFGLLSGLVGTLDIFVLSGLLLGMSEEPLNEYMRLKPNQGMYNAGRNTLRVGLVTGLVSGLVDTLIGVLGGVFIGKPSLGLLVGVFFGLLSGLFGGYIFSGMSLLNHYTIRFLLWRKRAMPLHYVRFLNEANERMLLQHVGGGYSFIHPLFQQYFASLSTAAPSTDIQQQLFGK